MGIFSNVRKPGWHTGNAGGPASVSAAWSQRLYEQRRRLATFAAAALALGVGYHVVFGHNGLTAYERKRQEMHSLDRQMRDLTHENDALEGHVERLQSDPDSIEHQAREELHYTRPGEVIVTLPPDNLSQQAKALRDVRQ